MNRIEIVQNYVNHVFNEILCINEKQAAFIHSYGVAGYCAFLAEKRKINAEIATIIGLLHDIYSYKTGIRCLHANNGAEMVRVAFKYELNHLFSEEEQIIIRSAIYHHSDKDHIHDEYDELLKDCDVLQRFLFNTTSDHRCHKRLAMLAKELNIDLPTLVYDQETEKTTLFNQTLLADIAEKLAGKEIAGVQEDPDYMEIIKYYPEDFAPSELSNAWCAAFVYHCCISAGLELPLRSPNNSVHLANCRFACVLAWYEWADAHKYCFYERNGFYPQRGDIVVYKNIIQTEHKQEDSAWCDHIGIVLDCDNKTLTVAEGNIENQNISGIIKRERNDTIGCYIRIPSDYRSDDWKVDYKTNKLRTRKYEL